MIIDITPMVSISKQDFDKRISETKAEVAREIFEEIEKIIGKRLFIDDHIRTYAQDQSLSYKTLAELKKKYTEEQT